jgi:TM2 domain-containing membrane protein YozV
MTILSLSLFLGTSGVMLFNSFSGGLNLAIWSLALLSSLGLLLWRFRMLRPSGLFLITVGLFFAATFAWRASTVLFSLNILALLLLGGVAMQRLTQDRFVTAGVLDYSFRILTSWCKLPLAYVKLLFRDTRNTEARGTTQSAFGPLLRGTLLSLPLLLLFGTLLVAADSGFADMVRRLFNWDFADLITTGSKLLFWSTVAGGFLRQILLGQQEGGEQSTSTGSGWLGRVETTMVLGSLDLLFFAFIALQFSYFFGGSDGMLAYGLNRSEYARRGFFELVTVAALAISLLLALDWGVKRHEPSVVKSYRKLASFMVLLLFALLASALHRMYLYQRACGLTELRFYTTFFMAWLGLILFWFMGTVLRGRRHYFAFGALVSGIGIIALLNLINPDGIICRENLARQMSGRTVDIPYLAGLSTDALPDLLAGVAMMPEKERTEASAAIYNCWQYQINSEASWRDWSWSRQQATLAFNSQIATLIPPVGPPPAAQTLSPSN